MTHKTFLVRSDDEINVIVSYTWYRAHAGATDGRYGPKLEPDEPAHFEIDDVRDAQGNPIEVTDDEYSDLIAELWENGTTVDYPED